MYFPPPREADRLALVAVIAAGAAVSLSLAAFGFCLILGGL